MPSTNRPVFAGLIFSFAIAATLFAVRFTTSVDHSPSSPATPPPPTATVQPSPTAKPSPAVQVVANQSDTKATVQADSATSMNSDTEAKIKALYQKLLSRENWDSLEASGNIALELEPYGPAAKSTVWTLFDQTRRFCELDRDPSDASLQKLARAMKKINPDLEELLRYNFGHPEISKPDRKAIALAALRCLQLSPEIALPYFERELPTLSAHDLYLMEVMVRGMVYFGGANPESRIPLPDRLETRSEFIRERAIQEFRALPAAEQETILASLRERWALSTDDPDRVKVDPSETLQRLASRQMSERLVSSLKPNTLLIGCSSYCMAKGSPRGVDEIFLVQSAQVTLGDPNYIDPKVAERLGRYTVEVTGVSLVHGLRPDPTGKHLLDQTTRCGAQWPEMQEPDAYHQADQAGETREPHPYHRQIFRMDELRTQYLVSGFQSQDAPKWIGAPWTIGKATFPATLPFSERDRAKLATCEQLRHEKMPTSESILASIKQAGGTIVSDPHEYETLNRLPKSADQFYGAVGVEDATTQMHIPLYGLAPQGIETLRSFCKRNGPSFFMVSTNGTGQATCQNMLKKDDEYILTLKVSGAIAQQLQGWDDMLLSKTPLPPQTWRARPASREETQTARVQASRHLGAVGRLDPPVFASVKVIEAKDGRQVMILPLHLAEGPDDSFVTYVALGKERGEWRTLYGFVEESFDPFLDLDGDGFPEFRGIPGYQSTAIWRLLPDFKLLVERLGG